MATTEVLLHRARTVVESLPEYLGKEAHFSIFFIVGNAAEKLAVETGFTPGLDFAALREARIEPVFVLPAQSPGIVRGRTGLHVFHLGAPQANMDAANWKAIRNSLLTAELAVNCKAAEMYSQIEVPK